MIKVTHVIYDLNFGGMSKLLYDLVLSQIENNVIKPEILVLKKGGEVRKDFNKLNLRVISLNIKKPHYINMRQIKFIRSCFNSADIIHFHSFNVFLCLFATLVKSKVVFTEHGLFGFGRKIRLKDKIFYFMRGIFYKYYVDLIVANSVFTQKNIQDKLGISKKKVRVIYNGVDNNIKSSKKIIEQIRAMYGNKFIIGITARLADVKRIDLLIKIYKIFSEKHEESVLLIVGDGQSRVDLEHYVEKHNIGNVHFVGYKSNIFDYQSAFDISVLSSQNESFGLVAVESYIAEKPILVFRDGGALTEIVSKYDKNDIVDSINDMVKRLEYHFLFKSDNKKFNEVIEYFSSKRMENKYYLSYKNILKNNF